MYKKYFSEHTLYFTFFVIVSVFYIVNGYAVLSTNDDWALRNMLNAKGVYNTFIMSYPLSYVISRLYDLLPTWQWYSVLMAFVTGINFYIIARYIENLDSYLQKTILFILSFLWLTFLWFNMSITILTVTTVITAVGFIRYNLKLSFAFLLFASLLRLDIMLMLIPYYVVSYFILRNSLKITKKELFALIVLFLLIVSSLALQRQNAAYTKWLAFNKARSSIVDMGVMGVEKSFFTPEEWFLIIAGWWQDDTLLPTDKIINSSPTLAQVIQKNINKIHLLNFVKQYKFKHWLWLLLLASTLVMILNIQNRRAPFMLFLVGGIILLLITRDVERVTVPIMVLWAYILFESLKPYRAVNTLLLLLFSFIFYYYASGQYTYRYFKENTILQNEAHHLIANSHKICEASIFYPTAFIKEIDIIFKANYLFYENNWLQMNNKEILPGGWLVRHPFFYEAHNLTDLHDTRKYKTYYDYLIDEKTAFFGSKYLVKDKSFNILLHAYDRRYLKNRTSCRHKPVIIATSEHFAISQIQIDCNTTTRSH